MSERAAGPDAPGPGRSMPRLPWPPLMLLALLLLGLLAQVLVPLTLTLPWGRPAGLAVIACALAVEGWAALRFLRSRTTVLPHREAAALVTDGLFARSRNPIYVAHVVILLGCGLALRTWWMWIAAPVLAVALQRLAIRPEEAFLRARFGSAYDEYCARTRRWL